MNPLHRLTRWTRCHLLGQCELPESHPQQAFARLAETRRLATAARKQMNRLYDEAERGDVPENIWVHTALPPRGNRHAAVGPHTPRGTVRKQERPPS